METVQTEVVQVTVPIEWRERLKARAAERGQASTTDYILGLIAADLEPAYTDDETERQIIEGLEGGPGIVADSTFYAGIRREIDDALGKAKA